MTDRFRRAMNTRASIRRQLDASPLFDGRVQVVRALAGKPLTARCARCGQEWESYVDGFPNPETLTAFCGRHGHDDDGAA
jgi:hypothetical protein